MKERFLILLLLPLFLSLNLSAQDKNQQAYMKIFEAERYFDSGNFSNALDKLDQAEQILDTTNTQIEYWRSKSYMQLSDFENALESATYYLNNEPVTISVEYQDIEKLKAEALAGVENQIRQDSIAQVQMMRSEEDDFWMQIRRKNTIEDYEIYLKTYPDGHYTKLAKNKIKNIKVVTLPGSRLVDAVKLGDYNAITKLVLKDSVDVNHQVLRKKTIERKQGNVYEIYHESPLYMAIYKMDFRSIKFLLEHGADPNGIAYTEINTATKEEYRRSYLSSLMRLTSKNGLHKDKEDQTVELIRLLRDYGLDPNYVNGEPLALAVFYRVKGYRRSKVIRELLRMGADPKAKGLEHKGSYYSAMDLAKIRNDDYLMEMLKDKRYKKVRKSVH